MARSATPASTESRSATDSPRAPTATSCRGARSTTSAEARSSRPAGDTKKLLDRFVDGATQQARGDAPASWAQDGPSRTGTGVVWLVILGLLVLGLVGTFFVRGRTRKRQAEQERAQLERLRPVVDEDITAFGEELDRIGFQPTSPSSDDAMRRDYTHALDAYDEAKRADGSRPRAPGT